MRFVCFQKLWKIVRGVARVSQRYEMKSLLVKNEWNLTSLLVLSTSLEISDWPVYCFSPRLWLLQDLGILLTQLKCLFRRVPRSFQVEIQKMKVRRDFNQLVSILSEREAVFLTPFKNKLCTLSKTDNVWLWSREKILFE